MKYSHRWFCPGIFVLTVAPLLVQAFGQEDFFDLHLADFNPGVLPSWLLEVAEEDGSFDAERGWVVGSERPFGQGRLSFVLERDSLAGDLALTVFSSGEGTFAVQLADQEGRLLLADLAGHKVETVGGLGAMTVAIPLAEFPQAKEIVIRRLDGPLAIHHVSLTSLVGQSQPDTAPKTGGLSQSFASHLWQDAAGRIYGQPIEAIGASIVSRPLLELASAASGQLLTEEDLLALLQVLGLQGYQFDAINFVEAAGAGKAEVVDLYLRAGMPVNALGRNRYTALAEAATAGALPVLRLLLDRGAELEIKTAGGNTALWMATSNKHLEAVRLLVEHGANVNHRGAYGTPVIQTIILLNGDSVSIEMYRYLLANGASPDVADNRGWTLLHRAASSGGIGWLADALEYAKDIDAKNAQGYTPLMFAKYSSLLEKERLLLRAGATPWRIDLSSINDEFVYRIRRGEWSRATELLHEGADPNQIDIFGEPVIFSVIWRNSIWMLERMIAYGADLNVRDTHGRNLLGRVVSVYSASCEAMVDYLLALGLDPNYPTQEEMRRKMPYRTPLMSAAHSGNADRCQRLLAAGADPTIRNLPQRTAAMKAERAGHFQLARELRAAEELWEKRMSEVER